MLIALLIIFALIIVCAYRNGNKTKMEHYDAKVLNIPFIKCANACKQIAGCAGYGYDDKKKICYLSLSPILGKPYDSIYASDYDVSHKLCNKFYTITEPSSDTYPATNADKRNNATFLCIYNKDKPNQESHILLENNNKFTEYKNIEDVTNVIDLNQYDIYEFDWPPKQGTEKDFQRLVEERIKLYSAIKSDNDPLNDRPPPRYSNKEDKEYQIKIINPKYGFIKTNKYNEGEYLNTYQCEINVERDKCLNKCLNRDECKAVEWNPHYEKSDVTLSNKEAQVFKNVCCLKSTLGGFTERNSAHKNGTFYVKSLTSDLNKNLNIISAD